MSKEFRPWKIDETQRLPPSAQDCVGEDDVSRLMVTLVRASLDLSEIGGSYRSVLDQPPFDPRLMTALLLYGYASGVSSSQRIAMAAEERADFMMIVAGDPPGFRTISEFRKRRLNALAALFMQARPLLLLLPIGLSRHPLWPDEDATVIAGHSNRNWPS